MYARTKPPSIPMPPQIPVAWEFIDPAKAAAYLELNVERNRFVRRLWQSMLAMAMRRGEFVPTHQGIAFDHRGRLVDGQHRLRAIVESGVGCWLLVARNLSDEAMLAIDLHAKRKPNDQIKMIDEEITPTTSDVAIARAMKQGMDSRGATRTDCVLVTTAEIHGFLLEHWEAIRFAQRHSPSGTRAAPIRAAVARAYYRLDRERLARFVEVFATMLADTPREHAAVAFRKWCDDPKNHHIVGGGQSARATLYAMTAAAILAFFRGQEGRRLRPVEEDPWPLPAGGDDE